MDPQTASAPVPKRTFCSVPLPYPALPCCLPALCLFFCVPSCTPYASLRLLCTQLLPAAAPTPDLKHTHTFEWMPLPCHKESYHHVRALILLPACPRSAPLASLTSWRTAWAMTWCW